MKRIIKETLSDDNIRYRVETNRCFFGLIPCKWHTDEKMTNYGECIPALFSSLREAKLFCNQDPDNVIKKEVL